MQVNSVTFRFADCPKLADKFKELNLEHIYIGSGTKIFEIGGQLAIQFFGVLNEPTATQKEEFQKVMSALKALGGVVKE